MKLTFLSTQVKADFQAFSDGLIERWSAWRCVSLPKRCNSHGSGMPVEVSGFADGGFLESLFEEAVESSACGCHPTSFGTGAGDGNRLRDFLINLSRGETCLDLGPQAWLALCRCGYWPVNADESMALRLIGMRREGQRLVSAPRRAVLSASPSKLRRRASRRHLELVAAPPSSLPALTLVGRQSRLGRSLKRSGDVVFSAAVLGLGSPLFLLLAALVKLSSPGPVFYVQQRVGRGYRQFGCIKFRTMRPDADAVLAQVLERSPEMRAEFERDFKLRNDPRITPIGRFLRRSSLDELPQFLNVLRGEMSVVGPRPIVNKEIGRYGDYMDEVLAVRPGLTGLWQVSGRNNLSYPKRVRLDLAYARGRSLLLDLAIILRTFGVLLLPMDRGAY